MRTRPKDGTGSPRSQCGQVGPWKSLVRSSTWRHPCPFGNITQLWPVTSISDILWPYRRSLEQHIGLLDALRSHNVSFEASRKVANTWVEQPHLEDEGWDIRWEPLCEVEIDRWDSR